MATIGALTVEIAMNVAQLQKDVGQVQSMMQKMQKSMQDAGQATDNLSKMMSSALSSVTGLAAGYISLQGAMKAIALIDLSVKFDQARVAFDNAATSMGQDSDTLLARFKAASNGTVSSAAIMEDSMKWLSTGMSADKVAAIWDVARTAAKRTGEDVQTAAGNIGDAVETMRARTLLSYGLITPAQVKLVEELKATGAQYDILELIQANVAVQQAVIGKATENAAEQWQQMKANISDATDALKEWIATGVNAAASYAKSGNYVNDVIGAQGAYTDTQSQQIANSFGSYSAAGGQTIEDLKAIDAAKQAHAQAIADAKANAEAVATWAQKLEQVKNNFDAGVVGATALDKEIANINNSFNKMATDASKSKEAPAIAGIAGNIESYRQPSIDQATQKVALQADADHLVETLKYQKSQEDAKKEYNSLMESLDTNQLSESDTSMKAIIKSYTDSFNKLQDLRDKDVISAEQAYTDYQKIDDQLANAMAANTARIASENAKTTMESTLGAIDVKTYSQGYTTAADLQARIAAQNTAIASAREYADALQKTNPVAAAQQYLDIEKQVNEVLKEGADLQKLNGTMLDGISAGLQQVANSTNAYQQGLSLVTGITNRMTSDMNNFFDTSSSGFLDFKALAIKILQDISAEMMQDLIIKPLAAMAASGLSSMLGRYRRWTIRRVIRPWWW